MESLPVAPEGTDPLNVYVVDLPLSFAKEEFQALYEPFGSLVTSTVLSDPSSGQSRGIGFARYSNPDNAARALKETQGMMLPGATKPLLVRFARDSSRKHEEQTHSTLQRLHTHSLAQHPQAQQPQQPAHPPHAGYASYAQPYSYAPGYPAGLPYYPQYPQPLTSPAHRTALPTPPPPPPQHLQPQPPASSFANPPARANGTHATAGSSPAVPAPADYQQAWAAYYAQLGYPGYYAGYQYPAAAYPANAHYPYPTPHAPPAAPSFTPTAARAVAAAAAASSSSFPSASSSPPPASPATSTLPVSAAAVSGAASSLPSHTHSAASAAPPALPAGPSTASASTTSV